MDTLYCSGVSGVEFSSVEARKPGAKTAKFWLLREDGSTTENVKFTSDYQFGDFWSGSTSRRRGGRRCRIPRVKLVKRFILYAY